LQEAHSVSPGGGGFGDAIYWASGGLLNLVLAAIFGFQYMKTARKITASPERYLGPARRAGMSRLMLKSGNRRRWRELYAAFAV